jgi:hypothetical protein
MSDNEIELPKPKRTYNRKKSAVVTESPVTSDNLDVLPHSIDAVEPVVKPRRKYTRKSSAPVVDATESLSEDEHDTVAQLLASLNIPEPLPSTSSDEEPMPSTPSNKKPPRTDKQIASFEKMRQARISKSEELKHLKELEKERQLLDKESAKVAKMETKIVKRRSKKTVASPPTSSDEDIPQAPKLVKQVSTMPTILFV